MSRTSSAVHPVSRARRTDSPDSRRTVAPPRDSTSETKRMKRPSAPSSGPGAIAVRSACSSTWSTDAGSVASAAAANSAVGTRSTSARPRLVRVPRARAPSHSASRSTASAASVNARRSPNGRRQSSRSITDSALGAVPAGSPANSPSTSARTPRTAGQRTSGPSAPTVAPPFGAVPTRYAARGLSHQAWATVAHRAPAERERQTSNSGVGEKAGVSSPSSAISPAASATSASHPAWAVSTSRERARPARSRTPRAPERSTRGGKAVQRSPS
ncbi:MAG: hypothetical protein BWY94_02300 [Actinobacteria bacterium ADurb.BinA094]|nr:MAG: hypothetical protein BWY94_02300 [Actinobacteria bacterium ADurb.BinA094]